MPENLTIYAYDKPAGNRKKGEIDTFVVDFNPNTFTITNKFQYKDPKEKGKAGTDPQFERVPPLEFNIEFTLDGTGVAYSNFSKAHQTDYDNDKHDYVKKKIKELRTVTGSELNGDIHRPNYLAVLWGTFDIKCIITSLNIVYNLFDREGSPLRAKVTCGFVERYPPGQSERISQLESPDLTKEIVIKEGDILPLIAKDNYEDSAYYLQLAKANKLKNFRKVLPGTKLILPPMEESDE